MGVLLLEQAEGFFRAKLGNAGEVLHPEAIQNLSSLQFAFAQTQRALDGVGRALVIVCSDNLQ